MKFIVVDVPSQKESELAEIATVGKGFTIIVAQAVTTVVQAGVEFDVTSTKQYVEFEAKTGDVIVTVPLASISAD